MLYSIPMNHSRQPAFVIDLEGHSDIGAPIGVCPHVATVVRRWKTLLYFATPNHALSSVASPVPKLVWCLDCLEDLLVGRFFSWDCFSFQLFL